jgi:hypothetical protein
VLRAAVVVQGCTFGQQTGMRRLVMRVISSPCVWIPDDRFIMFTRTGQCRPLIAQIHDFTLHQMRCAPCCSLGLVRGLPDFQLGPQCAQVQSSGMLAALQKLQHSLPQGCNTCRTQAHTFMSALCLLHPARLAPEQAEDCTAPAEPPAHPKQLYSRHNPAVDCLCYCQCNPAS